MRRAPSSYCRQWFSSTVSFDRVRLDVLRSGPHSSSLYCSAPFECSHSIEEFKRHYEPLVQAGTRDESSSIALRGRISGIFFLS